MFTKISHILKQTCSFQLLLAGLFRYAWHFSRHQALTGWNCICRNYLFSWKFEIMLVEKKIFETSKEYPLESKWNRFQIRHCLKKKKCWNMLSRKTTVHRNKDKTINAILTSCVHIIQCNYITDIFTQKDYVSPSVILL